MDDHLNPWVSVPSRLPYVLQRDGDAVTEYNARCQAEEYRLQTDVLPAPFMGNVTASVASSSGRSFKRCFANYSEVPSAFPFHYLDPVIECSSGAK